VRLEQFAQFLLGAQRYRGRRPFSFAQVSERFCARQRMVFAAQYCSQIVEQVFLDQIGR
jgi:hypothetical protein